MNNQTFHTVLLISGFIFLILAVVGNSKLGVAEINPGCFGRFLALIIGLLCLTIAVALIIFPADILLEVMRNILAESLKTYGVSLK